MLSDADDSLAGWLAALVPVGVGVEIGMPVDADRPGPPKPRDAVLHAHLHRVRESPDGSGAGWDELRSADGVLIGRAPPARRYRLTYLLMAVAGTVRAEHEILGRVLGGAALSEVVPGEFLRGSLTGDGIGPPMTVLARCAPEESFLDPAVLWAAWRIPPRTSLEMSLLVPMPLTFVTVLPEPPREIDLRSDRREAPALVPGGDRPRAARRRARVSED